MIFLCKQNLDKGNDPVAAFVLSSEAAVNGAESTKEMQPQVSNVFYKYAVTIIFFPYFFFIVLEHG